MSARRLSCSCGGQPLGLAEDLDVRAQRGDRRAQLVAGVRDQVALRLHRALERVERAVEALRQARQLVAALDLQPARQVEVARQRLGALGEARDRRERRARDQRPEQRRQHDAARADQREDQQQPAELVFDLASAAARPAPRRAAPCRASARAASCPSTLRSRQAAAAAARRDRPVARRQRDPRAARRPGRRARTPGPAGR